MKIEWENKFKNYIKAENAIKEAVENKTEILFFPEMSFTGFSMNIKVTSESNYETVKFISQLCKRYKIAVGFGWTERYYDKAKNCYSIVDKNGEEISRYIKIHPFSYGGEDKYFIKGDKLKYFTIGNTTFSTAICYDLRFPELFQGICKYDKTDVIVVPANWPAKRSEHWRVLTTARAIENQVYIIAVNCVGNIGELQYTGNSYVITPNGEIICQAIDNKEMICYVDIDFNTEKYRNLFPVKNDRQIEFYKSII